ncbi:unnamed protein product [Phyllotreta striolata]|uniref:Adenosine deaminase n=1 Tax=Phyllotreta striolata TaxID=444603 RepID=A0A9N9TSX2_PHYSR|nr:unnamed protein product [Phyllotreta striolata]
MKAVLGVLLILVTVAPNLTMISVSESDNYVRRRDEILKLEAAEFLGGNVNLSVKEKRVDEVIQAARKREMIKAHENSSEFLPSQHFFKVKNKISTSEVFSIIRKLPKGGSLHTHFLAGVSLDYIIKNITYRKDIYGGYVNGVFKLKFFAEGDPNANATWTKLEKYRQSDPNFDLWLKTQLSLVVENPQETYPTADAIWTKFKKTFTTQYDMVCYKPIFEDYIYQLLKELHDDNVMYTELRGTFMPLYELNGTIYNKEEFFEIFIGVTEKFKRDHPDFLGVRYIHNLYRGVSVEDLTVDLQELVELQEKFPDFICGFDFVGHEEEGHRLFDFHRALLPFAGRLKFFFHAGETNWFGSTDLNLIDAILLNASRIGHGFSFDKHPKLAEMAREKDICVELCPVSNQVLKLVDDSRNHPAVNLLARGFPVVVCNDDPAVWGAEGLSYDWYVAFMAMTPEGAGLKVLKRLASNSLLYSSMGESGKRDSVRKWEQKWEVFLDEILNQYNNV